MRFVLLIVVCLVLTTALQHQRVYQGSGIHLGRLRRFFQGLRRVGRSRRIAPQQCVHFFESHPPIGPENPIVVVHHSMVPFTGVCWRRLESVYRRRVQPDTNTIITVKIVPFVTATIPTTLCSRFRYLGILDLNYAAPLVPQGAIASQCAHLHTVTLQLSNTPIRIATNAIHHTPNLHRMYVFLHTLT